MEEAIKQVRVDNWGIFFLQRLQFFFNKTDYCDLTLQFEGNVQLKVHRLVINACTEYFRVLEENCEVIEDILIMPEDLQADVVLPIVNFMYTGMLEYHMSVFEKLYKTATLMNIPILTKLLDAQKMPVVHLPIPKAIKSVPSLPFWNVPEKAVVPKLEDDLFQSPIPSRKQPIKRKHTPSPQQNKIASHYFTEQKRQAIPIDPLASVDNTPKPTRFEWPEDDLPSVNVFSSDFNDLSYTNKPLLTQNEEPRPSTSYEPLKDENDQMEDDEFLENVDKSSKEVNKRKNDSEPSNAKRVCLSNNEKENQEKQTPKINITPSGKVSTTDADHARIISEVLKKYPGLVKKRKNIRLKILAKSKLLPNKKPSQTKEPRNRTDSPIVEATGPWRCTQCTTDSETVEFVLYYLYRKHMADVHFEKFDSCMCKFCGHKSSKQNLLIYHQYSKHGVKPPTTYSFPKCHQCPYIALNETILIGHKAKHTKKEQQCESCNITFADLSALTSHLQITGHIGKSKPSYDCQYCAKKCQSTTSLFVHLRQNHRDDARRDGIVSVDEPVEEDEYVVPEQVCDNRKEKIKILSDVKIPTVEIPQSAVALEPSSEAEALNNVASGIATSLGLVDVVVLDDNQQYILHTENHESLQEGSEFILPDLQSSEAFTQTHDQVVSTGSNIAMLHNSDITSTDELVMVLTDQDYSNEHVEGLDGDNSNIVVLYSHPVDCQDNQFMSASDLVLTSQAGLIELRNTSSIVASTTPNFVVTQSSVPAQIESIELIQNEINGHQIQQKDEMSIQNKPDSIQSSENEQIYTNENVIIEQIQPLSEKNDSVDTTTSIDLIETEDNAISEADKPSNTIQNVDINIGYISDSDKTPGLQANLDNVRTEEQQTSEMTISEQLPQQLDNQMEIQENSTDNVDSLTTQNQVSIENNVEQQKDIEIQKEVETESEVVNSSSLEVDVMVEDNSVLPQDDMSLEEEVVESHNDADTSKIEEELVHSQKSSKNEEDINQSLAGNSDQLECETTKPPESNSIEHAPQSPKDTVSELPVDSTQLEEKLLETEVEENLQERLFPKNDNSEKSGIDCNPPAKLKKVINRKTAKIILADWEDTDSQQSASNVNKLIDDWDDEDDEGKKTEL